MDDALNKVRQFHEIFQCYSQDRPRADIPAEQVAVRVRLLQEELDEYVQAAQDHDLVGIADALTDLLYVLLGTYIAHGLDGAAGELFDEVHRSNLTKLDENGQPLLRADGKILKSALFTAPDLAPILARHLPAADRHILLEAAASSPEQSPHPLGKRPN